MAVRTLTFLMTDIQGSTRLWEHFPTAMPSVIKRHDAIVLNAVSGNGGRLIKSKGEGDSTFSVFDSPTNAVRAAIGAQAALGFEPWPDGVGVQVRMALHMGEPEMRDEDFFGPTVNRCARIREVGHGGQILASDAVRELAYAGDPARWKDLGVHRLRDLMRPEHVWQVLAVGLQDTFPKLKSLTVFRNNLPVQLTSFVGRLGELEKVKRLMERHRLVTVVGFGGDGKTRLVLQLGAEVDEDSTAGVWFVALESLRTAREVEASILIVLGGDSEAEFTAENLSKFVEPASVTWLILDNAEHLTAIVRPIVALLLREVPGMRILVSSREPLHQTGEAVHRIPGLSLPPEHEASIKSLEDSEAGQLFLSRAAARTSDLRLSETSAKAIGGICRLLNGVPLAIEQAASLVAVMSPTQILERLQTRLDLLSSENPDAPERHRSLEATIKWSYELLTDDERKLFLVVSLFRDSFVAEAATYLAQQFVETEVRALSLFRELVDKSLVTANYDQESELRFRLLDTIRHFSAVRVGDSFDTWMSWYVNWYVQFAQSADAELYGPHQMRWLEKCQAEQPNFRKALAWCQEHDDERLLPLAFSLRKYWLRKGLLTEARSNLSRAYDVASDDSDPSRSTIANVLGAFAAAQDDYETALSNYKIALIGFTATSDTRQLVAVHNNIGIALDGLGRLTDANDHYLLAIEAARADGQNDMLSFSLLNYSITQRKLECLDVAEKAAYESLLLAKEDQDKGRSAMAQSSLCSIAIELRQPWDAAQHAQDALATWAVEGNPMHIGVVLLNVARLAWGDQRGDEAVKLAAGAVSLLESAGAGRDPDSTLLADQLLAEAAAKFPPATLHRWKSEGRTSAADQLVRLAEDVCQHIIGNKT